MNKLKYWLLDSVVEYQIELSVLLSPDLVEIINKRPHQSSKNDLVSTLFELFEDGDLIAQHNNIQYPITNKSATVPPISKSEIQLALEGNLSILYGLTTQGGQKWEQLSYPNWDNYISIVMDVSDTNIQLEICSAIEAFSRMKFNSYQSASNMKLIEGKHNILIPWEATYWKTLPIGHRFTGIYQVEQLDKVDLYDLVGENAWYTDYFIL